VSTPFKKLVTSLIKRNAIKRGPTSSDAWNDTVEELSNDLSRLTSTWNDLLFPLLDSLPNGTDDLNAFTAGLDGTVVYVDQDAVLNVADNKYFNSVHSRPNSIKDQFEAVYTKIATTQTTLEAEITNQSGALTQGQKDSIGAHIFDSGATSSSSSLDGKSENSRLNDNQLAKDLYGAGYTLDNDGNANLTNSVKDMVNALLLIHNGSWAGDVTVDHTSLGFGDFKSDGSVAMTGVLKAANGTAGSPAITFNSDQNTGIYRVAEDQLGISIGGANTLIFGGAGAEITPVDGSLNIIGNILTGASGSIQAGTGSGDFVTSGNGYGIMALGHGRPWSILSGTTNGPIYSTTDNIVNNASSIAHTFTSAVTFATGGAKLASFQNNGVEKAFFDKDGLLSLAPGGSNGVITGNWQLQYAGSGIVSLDTVGSGSKIRLQSSVADTGAAIGLTVNNTVSLTASGAKLVSFQNSAVEKTYIDKDGSIFLSNTAAKVSVGGPYIARSTVDGGLILDQADGAGLFHFQVSSNDVATIGSTGDLSINVSGTNRLAFTPGVGDSGSAVAYKFDTGINLVTSGALLFSLRNFGTQKLSVDLNGSIKIVSGGGIGVGGSTANANQVTVPANDGAGFLVTGATVVDQRGIQSFNRNAFLTVPDGNATVTLQSKVTDGSSAVGITLNSGTALANATAKLISIQNNAVEKLAIDKDGTLFFTGAAVPAGASSANWIGCNGATSGDMIINVPSGRALLLRANGSNIAVHTAGGGFALSGVTAVKSSAYTATTGDNLVLADPNAAVGSFAITLPAANAQKGQLLTVKVVTTHATRVITVVKAGTDTIEGVTAGQTTSTFGTTTNLASATYQSDGTSKWYLISSNGTVT
jgi:hypothetical protein